MKAVTAHIPSSLAIHGGPKVRDKLFPAHITVGEEEKKLVCEVIDTGILSNYLGAWHENFMGGHYVKQCEAAWAKHFGAKHALAVNSNTSGLIAAMGAIGIEPGDEVIVSPYSMSISAVAPIFYGAVPVFADVEPDTFCLSVESIRSVITPRTKAILVVDLFGQPFDAVGIRALARQHNLKIIEDCAQAPGAMLNGEYAGLLGDIGVFSMNYHKHIHSGEGGIIVTNDDQIAERAALIRNHAESVVGPKGLEDISNMVGFNFRMTEIEAAIAQLQIGKLDGLLAERLDRVRLFEKKMAGFPALTMPKVRDGAKHVYYVHACLWNHETGINRDKFISAVKAELPFFALREKEGVKLGFGYVRPLYLLPLFQKRIAFGRHGYPIADAWQNYALGLCPNVEALHFRNIVTHEFIVPSMTEADIDDVVSAFEKVWDARHSI